MVTSNFLKSNALDLETVTYTRKRRTLRVPKYRMIALEGSYKANDYQEAYGDDFLKILLGVSKTAQKTFLKLHENYDEKTGVSVIAALDTQVDKNAFSKGYKELHTAGLVKRVKRQQYLINPRSYINPTLYESLCLLWDSL